MGGLLDGPREVVLASAEGPAPPPGGQPRSALAVAHDGRNRGPCWRWQKEIRGLNDVGPLILGIELKEYLAELVGGDGEILRRSPVNACNPEEPALAAP